LRDEKKTVTVLMFAAAFAVGSEFKCVGPMQGGDRARSNDEAGGMTAMSFRSSERVLVVEPLGLVGAADLTLGIL